MKDGGWIPIDKRLVNLLPKRGEYTFLEAYISLRVDLDSGAEISINGYSRMWSWSRNKVRYFVEGLRTGKGHSVDTQRTGKGQEIRLFFNNLQEAGDRLRTGKGQAKDRQGTTTIDTNTKPKEKPIGEMLEICKAWKAFVEMRKLIKKPMTEYAMRLKIGTLQKLCESGTDPIAIINQSVSKNWQDFYPLKTEEVITVQAEQVYKASPALKKRMEQIANA
jgi:hypothetical protein